MPYHSATYQENIIYVKKHTIFNDANVTFWRAPTSHKQYNHDLLCWSPFGNDTYLTFLKRCQRGI